MTQLFCQYCARLYTHFLFLTKNRTKNAHIMKYTVQTFCPKPVLEPRHLLQCGTYLVYSSWITLISSDFYTSRTVMKHISLWMRFARRCVLQYEKQFIHVICLHETHRVLH
jgi:hypothetical protein